MVPPPPPPPPLTTCGRTTRDKRIKFVKMTCGVVFGARIIHTPAVLHQPGVSPPTPTAAVLPSGSLLFLRQERRFLNSPRPVGPLDCGTGALVRRGARAVPHLFFLRS